MSQFEEWFEDNQELLSSHDIPKYVAEIIWNSAKVSVLHNIVAAIQDGSLKFTLSL